MGIVLCLTGGFIMASAIHRLFQEGARFRHAFWAVMGFWIAFTGLFI